MLNVSQDYAQSLQRAWWRPSNAMGNQVLHGFHPLAAAATRLASDAASTIHPERIKMPKRGVNWANSKFLCNN